jgi:hypothetical protein
MQEENEDQLKLRINDLLKEGKHFEELYLKS